MTGSRKSILDDMLCFEVYSTEHAFSRLYKSLLAPLGLTYPQFLVMALLWQKDGQTVNGLGGQLGLESSTLTPLLKRMEKAELVRRARDPEDERRVRVSLTESGRDLRAAATGIGACVVEATGIAEPELRAMLLNLRRLRIGLQTHVAKKEVQLA